MANKLFRFVSNLIKLLLAYIIGMIVKVCNKRYRDVWIISERGYDARDNGFHLFKYINENHPEVNAWYIIDYKSADYEKVRKIGRTIEYKSGMHYLFFAISKVKISTHIMGYSPDIGAFMKFDDLGFIRGKKVFLQHGIIKDNLKCLHYPKVKLDLFVCGAFPEYHYVKETFRHPKDVVQYLGLCRFDKLKTQNKVFKQILLMPTWRTYLNKCNDVDDFMETEYYKVYQSLINNKHLETILKQYGFNLVFYPHFEVQKYINAFNKEHDNITIASFENYDVQELLRESDVLITDFSSVFFDFSYMKKPEIFYQFDERRFRESHYSEGYFDYRKMGFGTVVTNEKELVNELEYLLKKGCELQGVYLDRVDSFFTTINSKNCQRNFEAIKKLI